MNEEPRDLEDPLAWLELYHERCKQGENVNAEAGKPFTADDRTAILMGTFLDCIHAHANHCMACHEIVPDKVAMKCQECQQREEAEGEALLNLGEQLYISTKPPWRVVKISREDEVYIYYRQERTGKLGQRTRERFFECFALYDGPVSDNGIGNPRNNTAKPRGT